MASDARDAQGASDQIRALSEWFYTWELRGRGWQRWQYAVDIEPPFRSLAAPDPIGCAEAPDRARTFGQTSDDPTRPTTEYPRWHEPWAEPARTGISWRRFGLDWGSRSDALSDWRLPSLRLLAHLHHPLVLELTARHGAISALIAVSEEDADAVETDLLHSENLATTQNGEAESWPDSNAQQVHLVELGLAREFLIPLAIPQSKDAHPIERAHTAMKSVARDEVVLAQILIKPAGGAWAREMLRAALGPSDSGLFEDDLVTPCRNKIAAPLFAVVARIAGFAGSQSRAERIAIEVARALCGSTTGTANVLVALSDSGLDRAGIRRDLLDYTSHRSGMILNATELAQLLPFSGKAHVSGDRAADKSSIIRGTIVEEGISIGEDINDPLHAQIRLPLSDRLRHMRVVGEAGRSRTNLLARLILGDLEERGGVALIDCDGSLANLVMRRLPRHRLADTTLLDLPQTPVPIDLLNADSLVERSVLEGDVIAALSRLDKSWGVQSSVAFADAVAVLRSQDDVPTLIDVRRALAGRRQSVLQPRAIDTVVGVLDRLLERDDMRRVLSGSGRKLDLGRLLAGGTLLARIPDDVVGRAQGEALASLLLAKLHQTLIASASSPVFERPPFFLYVHATGQALARFALELVSAAKKSAVGLIVAGPAQPDAKEAARSARAASTYVSATCRGELRTARIQIGEAEYTVEIPDLPVEPRDAGQRACDIVGVTARRHGLADRDFAGPEKRAAYPKIPRVQMAPHNAPIPASGTHSLSRASDGRS